MDLTERDMKNPATGAKKVGDRMHKKIGPGMAKACSNVYKYTKIRMENSGCSL